jgi:hypothetical protein
MNRMYVLPEDELGDALYRRIYLLTCKNQGGWATRGAAFGLAGGMLSIVLAALLWALVTLLTQGHIKSILNTLETVFFILPLPLLALGAYCLDLLEKRYSLISLPAKSQPASFASLYHPRPRRPDQN